MTRTKNRPAWDAIKQLTEHYLADEQADYKCCSRMEQRNHIYSAWKQLEDWANADREEASRGYNGWSNYETWAVALWLDNEEHSQRHWREVTEECVHTAAYHPHARHGLLPAHLIARNLLAERLEAEVEEFAPDLDATLYADLLGAALEAVEWSEVAEHYLDGSESDSDIRS